MPLLRRACPEDAGGNGGSYQVNLDNEEGVGLGGVELIRAAMRKAARQLGWKATTVGMIGTRFGTMVAVQDTRDVPVGYRPMVDAAMEKRMSAALARVWGESDQPKGTAWVGRSEGAGVGCGPYGPFWGSPRRHAPEAQPARHPGSHHAQRGAGRPRR
ncbi:hypothetical protein [Streptomyces sp. NPDC059176]|uniref:hypothetical protein n=1 Tax=Streptomyces sp. NPDC059176 TaxID=3346758 RepID=UPI00368A7D82